MAMALVVAATSLNARAAAARDERGGAVSRTVLEQRLRRLDQRWLHAEANGNTAILDRLATSGYIAILPSGGVVTKTEQLKRSARLRKWGTSLTLDSFQLMALYGNVAIGTDHLTRKSHSGYGSKAPEHLLGTKIFVRQGRRWKVAAAAVVPLGSHPSTGARRQEQKHRELSAQDIELERQLWELDQQWEKAVRDKDLAYLERIFAPKCFLVLPGARLVNKQQTLDLVGKAPHGSEVKAYPDQFQLRAVYGNFAITTDRTVLKGAVVAGAHGTGEYRTLKFFVRQDGKWLVAGAADVPIPPA